MTSVRRPRPESRVKAGDSFAGDQLDFFQRFEGEAPQPADVDIHHELLGAIGYALREARNRGMSRERIVDEMNRLLPDLERPITLRQLNSWTAASREYSEFPCRFLAAFCLATDCELPLRRMARAIGRDLVDRREVVAKEAGEMLAEAAAMKRAAQKRLRSLGG